MVKILQDMLSTVVGRRNFGGKEGNKNNSILDEETGVSNYFKGVSIIHNSQCIQYTCTYRGFIVDHGDMAFLVHGDKLIVNNRDFTP